MAPLIKRFKLDMIRGLSLVWFSTVGFDYFLWLAYCAGSEKFSPELVLFSWVNIPIVWRLFVYLFGAFFWGKKKLALESYSIW